MPPKKDVPTEEVPENLDKGAPKCGKGRGRAPPPTAEPAPKKPRKEAVKGEVEKNDTEGKMYMGTDCSGSVSEGDYCGDVVLCKDCRSRGLEESK